MSIETPSKTTKLCPTCGTRLSEDAARCLVCGADLATAEKPSRPVKTVQGSRMPELTLSLPAVLGLLILFLALGAVGVYFALGRSSGVAAAITPTATETLTPTASITTTPEPPTATHTSAPSATPMVYKVAAGDTCLSIAYSFGVSVNSIVLLNELPASCDTIYPGQELRIPQPTATPTELPTSTLSAAEATDVACQKLDYTVQDNDTLSSIAANYAIEINALKEYNGRVNDTVRSGEVIKIPLCLQNRNPGGATSTPTPPPPYPAPNLLLPADGAAFTLADESIILQWAAVATLRENEAYAVTLTDVTSGTGQKIVEYVTDTKFIVPATLRPADNLPHIFRWVIITVRQVDTDNDGNPVWEPAGAASEPRDFTWVGLGAAATPTP